MAVLVSLSVFSLTPPLLTLLVSWSRKKATVRVRAIRRNFGKRLSTRNPNAKEGKSATRSQRKSAGKKPKARATETARKRKKHPHHKKSRASEMKRFGWVTRWEERSMC